MYSGRCAWTKYGNAVNAFNQSRDFMDRNTFEDTYYKLYEIVDLAEFYKENSRG